MKNKFVMRAISLIVALSFIVPSSSVTIYAEELIQQGVETITTAISEWKNKYLAAAPVEDELTTTSTPLTIDDLLVNASSATPSATITNVNGKLTVNTAGLILLSNVNGSLSGYSIYFSNLDGDYMDLTKTVTYKGEEYTFQGLGRVATPYSGDLTSQLSTVGLILNRPLFNSINLTEVSISVLKNLKIKSAVDGTTLFAKNIVGTTDSSWSTLNIEVIENKKTEGGSVTYFYPGSIFGNVSENASFSINNIDYQTKVLIDSEYDAGILASSIKESGSVSLNSLTFDEVEITSTSNAGILAGSMETGASISIANSVETTSNQTITGSNSGCIAGMAKDVVISDLSININGSNINASESAGGLFGSYTTTGETDTYIEYDGNSNIKVTSVNITTSVDGKYLGGIFGKLDLCHDFTVTNSTMTVNAKGSKSYLGGVAGKVSTSTPHSSNLYALVLSGDNTITTNNSNSIAFYSIGGVVAELGDGTNGDCLHINGNLNIVNNNIFVNYYNVVYGGLCGRELKKSVVEISDTSNVNITTNSKINPGGSLVGYMADESTLSLSGTTNLSNVSEYQLANDKVGQIVGEQGRSLIYAKENWKLIRSNTAAEIDDIGNFGSVIRLGKNIGNGTTHGEGVGLSSNLISQDPTSHKTVINKALKANLSSGQIVIANEDQFALLAIANQTKDAFEIYGSKGNYILKSNTIKLSSNINLKSTGISGLQRDISDDTFTGTFDGDGHTIILATGEEYGLRNGAAATGAGSGQIHRHNRVGLFSYAKATIKGLTIEGTINVRPGRELYVGGIVAYVDGASSIGNTGTDKVVTKANINCQIDGLTSKIGGIVGKRDSSSTLTLNNVEGKAVFSGKGTEYFGGLIGNSENGQVVIKNSLLAGEIGTTSSVDANVAGAISLVNNTAITIENLEVNGQTIETGASTSCGGFLGHTWNNATVTVGKKSTNSDGVTVKGNSSIALSGNANLGALCYYSSGYWQVNDINLEKMSIDCKKALGLLIYNSYSEDKLLYLEETGYHAYDITNGGVTITGNPTLFDEWIVYTAENASSITNNRNSVISIATQNRTVDVSSSTCTSYVNRTAYGKALNTSKANPNARYYYNLDYFRDSTNGIASGSDGKINSPAELVMWSVGVYSGGSNISSYFKIGDAAMTNIVGNGTLVDLTGYSYYPVNFDAKNLSIENIKVKFANDIIELAEGSDSSDSMDRTTRGTSTVHTQHYLMHSGIVLNYTNTSRTNGVNEVVTLSVNNVTLQGKVGYGPNNSGSGAIVCGEVGGTENAVHYSKISIDGLILNNIAVNDPLTDSSIRPLVVNKVGSYSAVSAQNISTTGYTNPSKANPSATSLIGEVGSETATNISVAFYNNIALSGKNSNSIFSHATLLESFRYSDANSTGYYHFTEEESFTFGKEISESVENAGLQKYYYQSSVEVDDNGNKNFASGYLPYVCHAYSESDKYHELEVNITKPDLITGCGTYDDPYILTEAGQLELVAKYINTLEGAGDGWKINMVDVATNVKTDADDNHTTYEKGTATWNDATVRDYLRKAYYKINVEMDLKSFAGIGTEEYPFVGVISGGNNTIYINATNNDSGFVNATYGCVVIDLSIEYYNEKTITGTSTAMSNIVNDKTYFGGIIGHVIGGDSIVSNVRVSFSSETGKAFSINPTGSQCAGGFFGIVEGGGIVLRNMSAQNGLVINDASIYCDKYIGRVLDGYVINEDGSTTVSSSFEGKNYSIPSIDTIVDDSSEAILDITSSGNISVSLKNEQQLIILQSIISSGSSNNSKSLSYISGKARTHKIKDYSLMGTAITSTSPVFVQAIKDAQNISSTNLPYLISEYVSESSEALALYALCDTGKLSINIDNSLDMTPYKNGYRSIGGRYVCSANRTSQTSVTYTYTLPMIDTVLGNDNTIVVDINIDEEGSSVENFYAIAVGGLFNVLNHNTASVSNLNVYGNVVIQSGLTSNVATTTYTNRAPVGGIIGRDLAISTKTGKEDVHYLTLNDLKFGSSTERSTVYGECVSGGLIGSSGSYFYLYQNASSNISVLQINNCSYDNVDITSGVCTGGFIGAVNKNQKEIAKFGFEYTPSTTKYVKITNTKDIIAGNNSKIINLYDIHSNNDGNTPTGVGGVIGFSSSRFSISGTEDNPLKVSNTYVSGYGTQYMRTRAGGIVGFGCNKSEYSSTINYVEVDSVQVGDDTHWNDNSGSIIGAWYSGNSSSYFYLNNATINNTKLYGSSVGCIAGYSNREMRCQNITLDGNYVKGSNRTGMLFGNTNVYLNVINVLIKNSELVKKSGSVGRLAGVSSGLRILGLSIVQENGKKFPTNYDSPSIYMTESGVVGNYNYFSIGYGNKNYVVYDGFNNGNITSGEDLETLPTVSVDGLETKKLHGDTLTPSKVIEIAEDSSSLYYWKWISNNGVKLINSNIQSSYNEQQDTKLDNSDDFEVLLVDGDASVLRNYLNVATNGGYECMRTFEYWYQKVATGSTQNRTDHRMKVTIERYKNNNGTFVLADPNQYPATLSFDINTGEFSTTAEYDNNNDTFTLITITMSGYDKSVTRTIHIPVVVRRMLQIDFIAVMNGMSSFNVTDEVQHAFNTHALANQGEDITGYLTFKYNSKENTEMTYNWQSYIEGGGDVLGSYKKTISTGLTNLPEGTKITLVDCQNNDKRYFATVGSGGSSLEISDTFGYVSSDNEAFKSSSLAKLLEITSQTDDSGLFVKLDTSTGATAQDKDGNYYRLKTTSAADASLQKYSLTVTNTSPEENYFVVINVPTKSNHKLTLDRTGMEWVGSSASSSGAPVDITQIRWNTDKYDANIDGENETSFNFLANYTHEVTDETESGSVPLSSADPTVTIDINSIERIEFDYTNYNEADPLYQEFVLTLKKTNDGVASGVAFPSDSNTGTKRVNLYAYYVDNSGNYHYYVYEDGSLVDKGSTKQAAVVYDWLAGSDGIMTLPFASIDGDTVTYIDLKAVRNASKNVGEFFVEVDSEVIMNYSSVLTNKTIPSNTTDTIVNYTQIDTASHLAMSESQLQYTSVISTSGNRSEDKTRKYYLTSSSEAVLELNYVNIDQLGININDNVTNEIDTVLSLDFSESEGFKPDVNEFHTLSEKTEITFTFTLTQKGKSSLTSKSYEAVNISEYITEMTYDGVTTKTFTITITKNADGSWPYYTPTTGRFEIPVTFIVKNYDITHYSNYRINVSVDGFSAVNNRRASITYTIAKINIDGIWDLALS